MKSILITLVFRQMGLFVEEPIRITIAAAVSLGIHLSMIPSEDHRVAIQKVSKSVTNNRLDMLLDLHMPSSLVPTFS